jgi:hypothetical protein
MAGMAPRWPIYRLDGDAGAVTRLKARAGLDPRERELPCNPGAAETLTAEVFGHGRADDLAHWRADGGAAVAIERGGELAAFAYRRGERIGPAAGRDETALLQAVAAAAAAGAGGGGSVTMRVPGPALPCSRRWSDAASASAPPDAVHGLAAVRATRTLPPLGAHPLLGAALTSSKVNWATSRGSNEERQPRA